MRFYRVELITNSASSGGFSYHTSRAAAVKAKADHKRDVGPENYVDSEIQAADIQPTRAGIIKLLNIWASHPDNG